MNRTILSIVCLLGMHFTYGQCPTTVTAISSSKIQIDFATADSCSSGDPIGYVALYVSGYSGYRGYFVSSSQLSNTSTTSVTIEDLDNYGQNFTGNTTAWTSSDVVTRIRTEDINFNGCNDCTNSFALPVNLVNFLANTSGNEVSLFWETATEVNNEKFEIERSLNATDFIKIGEVEGRGNSNEHQKYQFVDENVDNLSTKIYYRLKQIDYNGEFEYSNVLIVQKSYNPNEVVLVNYYANEQTVKVSINNPEFIPYSIEILNLRGEKLIESITADDFWEIGTADLPKGMYLIKVGSSKNVSFNCQKLIIH